jgi:septal ring factor EnvC (AmiA/AmiB activator)
MQSTLLESEERRKELETGIEVIQATLRRTVHERDAARAEVEELNVALYGETGTARTDADRASDLEAALEFLAGALDRTADERDALNMIALQTRQEADHVALEKRLLEDRTNLILARLEDAVQVSMEPLERVFRAAGLPPEQILNQVRSGMVRPEDRMTPLSISTSGTLVEDTDAERVNAILSGLERVNMYRIAGQRVPFAQPVTASVRFTSGFGNRRDPKTGRTRMHSGVDFAGPSGTAIKSTADGVVKKAGWQSGYGNAVVIEHAFGVETLYAHLSRINVSAGQRVSRGDVIGGMGTTGRSTGVHLHYEVRVGGNAVNPMTYIRAAQNVF